MTFCVGVGKAKPIAASMFRFHHGENSIFLRTIFLQVMKTTDKVLRSCLPNEVDVMVLGGGTAGVIAAVQAARAGARTLLVEKTGMLGGTITTGGVNFPGLFHAWGKQVIAGIGWELVERTVQESGGTMPDFSDFRQRHWKLQIPVDRFVYAAICDEMVKTSGVTPLFHTMLAELIEEKDGWCCRVCTKEGLQNIRTKVVVDASGDATAVGLAGAELMRSENCQPATLVSKAEGYRFEDLDIPAINQAFAQEVSAGRMQVTDFSWNTDKVDVGPWLRAGGGNAGHIHGFDARTSAGKSALELEARARLFRVVRFLRSQPGLENLYLSHVSPECGVRETVTIRGRVRVGVEDYTSGRHLPDAVCYAFYPIDLHTAEEKGLDCRPLEEGVVPTVPRDALIPKDSRNLLVAGRCLSSDQLANSALRVQATSMATGQAAGALAAERGCQPHEVPMEDLYDLLEGQGAIVPRECMSSVAQALPPAVSGRSA